MLQISNKILFITIFFIFPLASTSPSNAPSKEKGVTVPLTPPTHPHSPLYTQILKANNISTTAETITLDRSHYLQWLITKVSKPTNDYGETYRRPDAGYHIMDMYMGNPVQLVFGIFDTGSDLVWFQCEDRAGKGRRYPFYNHTLSTTYKPILCGDKSKCKATELIKHECQGGPDAFCDYSVEYADQTSSTGLMATDITCFKPTWEILHDFIFGCSKDNSDSMMGILGASNNKFSLPKQLYPYNPKFSYCISDDLSKKNFIRFGSDATLAGESLDMVRNRHYDFYYIDVVAIEVNGEDIDVKPSVFEMSDDGTNGFVIDSATTLTVLTSVAFSALQQKVEHFLGPATKYLVLPICYPSSTFTGWWKKSRPTIGIEFTRFVFQLAENRVWEKIPGSDLECLMVIRTFTRISILGYELLYNVNVGHDPIDGLLYLQQTTCPTA